MSWLKALAELNMYAMVVTAATFHAEMFWLKALAELNMLAMVVTNKTSQLPMGTPPCC